MAPEGIIAQLAACREHNLDQPDLLEHHSHPTWAWSAWAPMDTLIDLPREVQEVLDDAGRQLGLMDGPGRVYAWQCAQAGQRCGALSRQEASELATTAHLRPVARPGHWISKALAVITASIEYLLSAQRPNREGLLKTLRTATR